MPMDIDLTLSEIGWLEDRLSELPDEEKPKYIRDFAFEYREAANDLVKIVENLRRGGV